MHGAQDIQPASKAAVPQVPWRLGEVPPQHVCKPPGARVQAWRRTYAALHDRVAQHGGLAEVCGNDPPQRQQLQGDGWVERCAGAQRGKAQPVQAAACTAWARHTV